MVCSKVKDFDRRNEVLVLKIRIKLREHFMDLFDVISISSVKFVSLARMRMITSQKFANAYLFAKS